MTEAIEKRWKHGLRDGRTWRYRLGRMAEADEALEKVMVKHESCIMSDTVFCLRCVST